MGRFCAFFSMLVLSYSGNLQAQVIECPGFLPSSDLDQERQGILAKQLLGRFIASLDLYDIEAIDEETILFMYREHPEQLTIKLSYLALQCQIVVAGQDMTRAKRRKAVRRAFLDYVLMPPDVTAADLSDYVNELATKEPDGAVISLVSFIEDQLDEMPRRAWQKAWFGEAGEAAAWSAGASPHIGDWSVIVSSPRYENEGWIELQRHQASWPDVYFELDGPYDPESPFYAIIAGRHLSTRAADRLLEKVKSKGMANDAFRWRKPPPAVKSMTAANGMILPSPPRPDQINTRNAAPPSHDDAAPAPGSKT